MEIRFVFVFVFLIPASTLQSCKILTNFYFLISFILIFLINPNAKFQETSDVEHAGICATVICAQTVCADIKEDFHSATEVPIHSTDGSFSYCEHFLIMTVILIFKR